jgi:DNA repair protein RecO (recombination protein O)
VAIVEDQAFVLRSLRYGETSRIVTALGRTFGKVHLIAKGARGTKSPFGASLDPFSRVQIVFYLKKSRTLHLLKAAIVEKAYERILAHPETYYLASAALEFVQRVLPDEDPVPRVCDALDRFLGGCEHANGAAGDEQRLRAFQLHVVAHLGYAPQLDRCARCGRAPQPRGGFGVSEGGLLCRRCAGGRQVLPLSDATLSMLRRAVGLRSARPAGGTSSGRSGQPADRKELGAVVEAFLRYHVTGYQDLKSLRGFSEWRALTEDLAPGKRTPR